MPFGRPALILIILIPALVLGCGDVPPEADGDLPLVATSIFPAGDLTAWLVGDAARVRTILPPGASPATFDLTPRQLQELTGARLFIMVGGGLDEWVSRIPPLAQGDPTVVRLTDGIPLLAGDEHEHESGNPHVWLDPILVRDELLPRLEEALGDLLPQAASQVEERARMLSDSLTALDEEIRGLLDPVQNRAFVSTHPAFSYFALRYGLTEAGTVHAHPGEEPSSRELSHLLEVARAQGVHCLFMEPQVGEIAARALAQELGLPTCLLDPLGGPAVEGRDGYLALLRFNARQFAQGLEGHRP